MKYIEGGRFGRITKHLRKQGHEKEMEEILYDSKKFPKLKKPEQTKYVETVISRMEEIIGKKNSEKVLFECGAQCCGKSWSNFVKRIWNQSDSTTDFLKKLNKEEEKYHTHFTYDTERNSITVARSKCICGLINKGNRFRENNSYCKCSIGHMFAFFNAVLKVKKIEIQQSIYSGSEKCKWKVQLN
ncbi:hypothetical protein [Desulfogranum mediterraneum]|uniref:hypothetical protein n=1 Tax=Desulfogranum mediterraneum TaxID=160661 RepID=UPI000403BC1B|nr:hypothetical protein [Desulfogranum mediterraneum]